MLSTTIAELNEQSATMISRVSVSRQKHCRKNYNGIVRVASDSKILGSRDPGQPFIVH